MINPPMMVFVFVVSLVFHEFGHWWFFKYHKKKAVKLYYSEGDWWIGDWGNDYVGLTLSERKRLVWYGIFIGMIPIYFMMIFDLQYTWIFALYLIGCKRDFLKLKRLYNE